MVAGHHDRPDAEGGEHGSPGITEQQGGDCGAHGGEDGGQRDVPKAGGDAEPQGGGRQHGPRDEPQERPEPRGDALAAAEAEEDRPAVADDGGDRAGRRGARIAPRAARESATERHRGVALRDVSTEGEERRQASERSQYVGGADVPAAVAPDIGDAERSSHQIADRHRADHIGGDDRGGAHDQRSSPRTMAPEAALRKNRQKESTAEITGGPDGAPN